MNTDHHISLPADEPDLPFDFMELGAIFIELAERQYDYMVAAHEQGQPGCEKRAKALGLQFIAEGKAHAFASVYSTE